MLSIVTNKEDNDIKGMVELVAELCLSKEFETLRKELARLYTESDSKESEVNAFKDALFTMLVQNDHRFRTESEK